MRFRALDSWRGIAALFVAAFHFPTTGYLSAAPVVRHAYLFVDFFFVLSGFVIAHATREGLESPRAAGAFMLRRFGRVYPLYIVVLGLFAGTVALKHGLMAAAGLQAVHDARSAGGAGEFLLHAGLIQVFGLRQTLSWNWPDWSIAAEFWTYLVFALVLWAWPAQRRVLFAGILVLALSVLTKNPERGIDVTYDLGFVRCLYGFCAGVLTYEVWRRGSVAVSGVLATVLEVTALIVAGLFVAASGPPAMSLGAPAIFAFLVFVFAFDGGSVSRLLEAKACERLGTWSYSIYVGHALIVFVLGSAVSLIEKASDLTLWLDAGSAGHAQRILAPPGWLAPDAAMLAYLALVVAVSSMTHAGIEDPWRRYFNALSRGRQPGGRRVDFCALSKDAA